MSEAVNDVDATYETTCNVSVWKRRHLLDTVSVVSPIFIFDLDNEFRIRFLGSRMNIEWSSVLRRPLTTLKSLEPKHKETCPGLVHGETHALVICLFVEVSVTTEDLAIFARFIKNSFLYSLPELIKRVLSL